MLVAGKPAPAVGLIGYGQWGRNLARNFAACGALRVICDADGAAREAARRQHSLACVDDPAAVFSDPELDAVNHGAGLRSNQGGRGAAKREAVKISSG